MLNAAKNASFIHAIRLTATTSEHYGPKLSNTLSLKLSGVTEYVQDGNHLVTSAGKLLFIPSGAIFETHIREPGDFIEVKFHSSILPEPELRFYDGFDVAEMTEIFQNAVSAYGSKDLSAFFRCQIYLNTIFARLADVTEPPAQTKSSSVLLAPALSYLQENMFNVNFTIDKMQERAEMSETYFRSLFKNRFHCTPQRYVIMERIRLAQNLLTDHPSMPIGSVSKAVGYTDPFYFSKLFHKETGFSPSQFAQLARKNNR